MTACTATTPVWPIIVVTGIEQRSRPAAARGRGCSNRSDRQPGTAKTTVILCRTGAPTTAVTY
jgi:hypothetical protein